MSEDYCSGQTATVVMGRELELCSPGPRSSCVLAETPTSHLSKGERASACCRDAGCFREHAGSLSIRTSTHERAHKHTYTHMSHTKHRWGSSTGIFILTIRRSTVRETRLKTYTNLFFFWKRKNKIQTLGDRKCDIQVPAEVHSLAKLHRRFFFSPLFQLILAL